MVLRWAHDLCACWRSLLFEVEYRCCGILQDVGFNVDPEGVGLVGGN